MTSEQKAAYIFSQSIAAMIEAMGMVAENDFRKILGNQIAYTEDSFQIVLQKYGLDHNKIIQLFNE